MTSVSALSMWAKLKHQIGNFLLWLAPKLMKFLSIAGTAAMFLVGGGILTHGWGALHHLLEQGLVLLPAWGQPVASVVADGLVGVVTGGLVLLVVNGLNKLFSRKH